MSESVGIGTAVIGTLRRFRTFRAYQDVPIDYLPEATSRRPSEINAVLSDLQKSGVVVISNGKVRLLSSEERSKNKI
ncbi:hypothetical protein CCAX7_12450 [Capsulimonas corticalis]|uniref:Uncharacterized protein n=1 Tax=Capsulimonas corticalis TaxID=2219043 RepID=A0A402D4A6_9BACT|nr:hypothetical protein [Capsulimonas corticalis]BDI29194.1 hypothetical protein CCAX7_12450 [Capsulimonas corticalis]